MAYLPVYLFQQTHRYRIAATRSNTVSTAPMTDIKIARSRTFTVPVTLVSLSWLKDSLVLVERYIWISADLVDGTDGKFDKCCIDSASSVDIVSGVAVGVTIIVVGIVLFVSVIGIADLPVEATHFFCKIAIKNTMNTKIEVTLPRSKLILLIYLHI